MNVVCEPALGSSELKIYERDGFLVREQVFTEPEIEILRKAVERAANLAFAQCMAEQSRTYWLDNKRFVDVDFMTVQFEHEQNTETIRVIEPVHHLDSAIDLLIEDRRITAPISSILRTSEISVWTNKLNLKRGRGSGFGWHQDSPYWIHDSDHVDLLPNVMVTLDDATEANGCFKVIRGSHNKGCLPGTNDGSALGGFFTDPNSFDERNEVLMEVKAGSLVFFSPHAVHGSAPNTTDDDRRALILTYQPAGFPMLKSRAISRTISG